MIQLEYMRFKIFFILFLFTIPFTNFGQQKKASTNIKKAQYPILPDSFFSKFASCNGVDIVFFTAGKSMEFNDKNAQAPVSFISREGIKTLDGYKHIALFSYKINGSLLLDCDIHFNETNKVVVMKFKTKNKEYYYQKMTPEGVKVLLQWLK